MKTLYVVRCNCVDGREEDFNTWYNHVHLAEVLQIDGFLSAQRFELNDAQMLDAQRHTYMTLYEIDSNDVPGTLSNLRSATWLNMSDAIDLASLEVGVFSAMDAPTLSA